MVFSYNAANQTLSWTALDGYYQIGHLVNSVWYTIYSGTALSCQISLSSGNQVLSRISTKPTSPPVIPPTPSDSEYNANTEIIIV
jgi:hypothetical protein